MSLLRSCRAHLQQHRIVIPVLPSASSTARDEDLRILEQPHPQLASFLDTDAADALRRQQQLQRFKSATEQRLETVWRDSKSHLRKQAKLVEELGVEGAVRETLQPTRLSFRAELRQRPLDRAIMEEIYRDLHGKRIERFLKRGVSWEHWITKGDGTAPVFTTADKTQQLFAFGGQIVLRGAAAHPRHFPLLPRHPTRDDARRPTRRRTHRVTGQDGKWVERTRLVPEVAFIGRTGSGKSSLVNALVNAMVSPYGHLPGNTTTVRFYSVADRLVLVDCPGYGYYHPMNTPTLDAENAVRTMRAYLAACRVSHRTRQASSSEQTRDEEKDTGVVEQEEVNTMCRSGARVTWQPRNIKRVFLCVPARGMQHAEVEYCNLLERMAIPFSVVLTKTDRAPIRFLARLTDYTRCQLVDYKHCHEVMLTSALRLAGIDKMQNLIASMAAREDDMAGATMNFDDIV